ncbi:hypothetical protein [Alteromonas abrolhosensis]|uniref:hypothetical protein n=1 Tax=Alteromonas abrolhosensis TaxID=1892904 RepID=UPI00096BCACB|nr:hypothetical protein [Alteromonas abrolhosensis]|tara:strand:+ start:83 stop:1099 length:1017 start_codon:yes stop_codon:yes gene_type:complete
MGKNLSRMRFKTKQVSLYELVKMIEIGRLDYRSYFRLHASWNNRYKSQLIETMLLGLPNEEIWAEEDKFGKINILTGIDVISTLIDFKEGKFRLAGLRYLRNLEGYSFRTFNYSDRDDLFQTNINLNVIDHSLNPLLKCLFLKNKNKEKNIKFSNQSARNFCFPSAEERLRDFTIHIYEEFNLANNLGKKRQRASFILALQEDILVLVLVKLLKDRMLQNEISMYKRKNFNQFEDHYEHGFSDLEISYEDQLDIALDKIMFEINMHNSYLTNELSSTFDEVYHLINKDGQFLNQVGIISIFPIHRQRSPSLLQALFGRDTPLIRNDMHIWQLGKKLEL